MRDATQSDVNVYNMLTRIHQTSPKPLAQNGQQRPKMTSSSSSSAASANPPAITNLSQQQNTYPMTSYSKSTPTSTTNNNTINTNSTSIADVDDLVDFGSPFVDNNTITTWNQSNGSYMNGSATPSYSNYSSIFGNNDMSSFDGTNNINNIDLDTVFYSSNNQSCSNSTNSSSVQNLPTTRLASSSWSTSSSNELRSLHFVLILFSSLVNWSQLLSRDSNNNNLVVSTASAACYYPDAIVDVEYVQKIVLQMIDQVCKDQSVRAKIVLSISEIAES